MTDTQWLLDLVEEATPGPWRPHMAAIEASDGVVLAHSIAGADNNYARADADARLIALAPDLARLCVDQHEALAKIASCEQRVDGDVVSVARAALARFAELKP